MNSASSGGGSVAEVRFPGGRHKGCHLAQGKPSDRGDGPAVAGFLLLSRNLSSHTTRSPQLGFVGIPGWILPAKTPPVRIPGWIFQPRFPRRNPPEGLVYILMMMIAAALLVRSVIMAWPQTQQLMGYCVLAIRTTICKLKPKTAQIQANPPICGTGQMSV